MIYDIGKPHHNHKVMSEKIPVNLNKRLSNTSYIPSFRNIGQEIKKIGSKTEGFGKVVGVGGLVSGNYEVLPLAAASMALGSGVRSLGVITKNIKPKKDSVEKVVNNSFNIATKFV